MQGFPLFSIAGIPVFISFWYVIIVMYFAASWGMAQGLLWGLVLTISVLAHEFGHALVARHYGLRPSVLLHGWGGLTAHRPAERDKHSVFIIIAGPGAGFLLGLLVYAGAYVITQAQPSAFVDKPLAADFVTYMLYANLFWSGVNLIPMWPLDGGQLFHIALKQKLPEETAHRVAHGLGMVLSVITMVAGIFVFHWFFIGLLGGMLAYANYSRLRAGPIGGVRSVVRRTPNKHAAELYALALLAMEKHDWDDATRIGHQMRAMNLTDSQINDVWELLTVALTNRGDYEEALHYAERAPSSDPVEAARTRCLQALGRWEEADVPS